MKYKMNDIKALARKLVHEIVHDESGQSTTEYVLLLVFVVMAVKAVGGKLQAGLEKLINTAMGKATDAVESTQIQ